MRGGGGGGGSGGGVKPPPQMCKKVKILEIWKQMWKFLIERPPQKNGLPYFAYWIWGSQYFKGFKGSTVYLGQKDLGEDCISIFKLE